MKQSTTLMVGGGVAAFGLAAVIAVAVNILARPVNVRVDLTEERIYSLSDSTRNLLAGLPAKVTLKFYCTQNESSVPTPARNYIARVEDLLHEYERAAHGKLVVEKFNPKPDSDAEDWARRYGVEGHALGADGTVLYLGVVSKSADREAVIPFLDPRMENLLEYQLTRLVASVARPSRPVVGVISSLPVLGGPAPMMNPFMQQQPPQRPWYAFEELQQTCDVRPLQGTLDRIPDDIQALVLVQPGRLDDTTLFAIDQFLLGGGRILAFLDPLCAVAGASNPMMGMGGSEPGLDPLLQAWGVELVPGQVALDQNAAATVGAPGGGVMKHPAILDLVGTSFERRDVVMGGLESILLPYAGVLRVKGTPGVVSTPLIRTSSNSGMASAMAAQGGGDELRRALTGSEELTLAVRLQGTFKTAFPNGKPAAQPPATGTEAAKPDEPKPAVAAGGLKEGTKPGTVILVADADMLHDAASLREVEFAGQRLLQPGNDNITFLLNGAELLSGDTSLAGIRSRGKTERPFEVVRELKRRADKRYLAEEQQLMKDLEATEQRINELQGQKDEAQQTVWSKEQREAIQQFREKELKTRQALKEVRFKLREDIERLGYRVKALNVLLVPFLVIVGGVAFGASRRNRR